jgi:hypothetical protein
MIDNALEIWQRIAAACSPELATAINTELTVYNNLEDFVGLSFDEWAIGLGVRPLSESIFLPVISHKNDGQYIHRVRVPEKWVPSLNKTVCRTS